MDDFLEIIAVRRKQGLYTLMYYACWILIVIFAVVAAYSLGLFALFYYIIDVKGWKGWTKFFEVVGLNSITIYMAQRIIPFGSINRFFLDGLAGLCPEPVGALILSIGYFMISWLFLWFLYKKKVFLKV